MSKETLVILKDDIDGGEAVETLVFAVDGKGYEIDLSAKNAAAFRKAVAKYVDAARRATSDPVKSNRRPSRRTRELAEIRAWGREHGYSVPDRGRVPQEVHEAYAAAHK